MRRTKLYTFVALAGFFLITTACGQKPEINAQTTEVLPEGYITETNIRSDFQALYDGLKTAHSNLYAHQERSAYDDLFADMLSSFNGPRSLLDVQKEFQKFTAFGNVGHARIEFPSKAHGDYRAKGGKAFPVYLRFQNGLPFIDQNYSGIDSIQPGMELISVNNVPVDEFLLSLEQHISADSRYMAHSLLEFSLPQYIWLEYGQIERFSLVLRQEDGQMIAVEVPARTQLELEEATKASSAVFTLSSHQRVTEILDNNIGYLRPGPFYSLETPDNPWDNEGFSDFIDGAFQSYLNANVNDLIIDLRLNPGGDNSFSDLMIAWFADEAFSFASEFIVRSSPQAQASNQARLDLNPESVEGVSGQYAKLYEQTPYGETFDFHITKHPPRKNETFDGNIFVLVDRHSFSNAVNVAAIVQDYGFGTIIGEKTSDMATTYGAMESFTLPETELTVGFPKAHIIRPNGTRKVDGVSPDISVLRPLKPSSNDFVLEKAQKIVRARSR